jgi:predicted nucleotidyltransferase
MELEVSKIESFVSKVDRKLDDRVEKAVLFGSYARGNQVPGSDVDIMIVLKDWKKGDQSKVSKIASKYFEEENVFISPKLITADELEQKKDYSFFQEIREEGVSIYG